MTDPRTQALYVMQNEFGLIKIGRSIHPDRRRLALKTNERCEIAVVSVLDGQGHREEEVHFRLKRHLIEGEWFKGTDTARLAIVKAIPDLEGVRWPFDYDRSRARAWLEEFFGRRDQRSIERQFRRILDVHVRNREPGSAVDLMIHGMLSLSETGEWTAGWRTRTPTGVIAQYCPRGSTERLPVPEYTSDAVAALSLWPEDIRPPAWDGTAYDCAMAAMELRYRRLRSNGALSSN